LTRSPDPGIPESGHFAPLLWLAVVAATQERGVDRLLLETGVGPGFTAAWRLYERNGFTRRGPFLDYPDSGWSAFFERRLAPEAGESERVS
jgi:putative acetyltransferase